MDIKRDDGQTPLDVAVNLDKKNVATILLKHAADLSDQSNIGLTPPHENITTFENGDSIDVSSIQFRHMN